MKYHNTTLLLCICVIVWVSASVAWDHSPKRKKLSNTVQRLHKRNHKFPQQGVVKGFTVRRGSSTPSFKFRPRLDDSMALKKLTNKRIVFMGDSTTRYQYLNMAYFLERKKFPLPYCTDEKLGHSVCCQQNIIEGSKDIGWDLFFQSTNGGLNGHEICDCSRKKNFNLENRVYHNEDYNTTVAFFWLGRDLGINLRGDMFTFPLKSACSLSGDSDTTSESRNIPSSCNNKNYVVTRYDNVTKIGDAVYNITLSFNPDIFLMNWGHHSTYLWKNGLGRQQYDSITNAAKLLRADNYKVHFYWKSTTPIYSCLSLSTDSQSVSSSCGLKLMDEKDSLTPKKLGNKLVQDRTLKLFDAQHYVQLLHDEFNHRQRLDASVRKPISINETGCFPHKANYNLCESNPIGWDSLHFYCWINTELNRALIASESINSDL